MFILGDNVKHLEKELAAYCGARYAIGVGNGSDALYLALLAAGVGPGDEVITTPFTFYATAGAIERVGAKPVFTDIEKDTFNIDPNLIEAKITGKTRAIIPVHLYGCPADMGPIVELAGKYQLKVIEDGAQSLGALYKGRKVGAIGDMGCLSFFPTKNLGAFGDGGAVLTSDPELAEKVRMLRVHGAKTKYYHELPGCNSRLDELQAAILRVKMPYLEGWNRRRREIASRYRDKLSGLEEKGMLMLPKTPDYAEHVFHQYTIQLEDRDGLRDYLKQQGVGSTVYYPVPLHLQKVFQPLGYKEGDFPVAEAACRKVLSLPMFPELTDDEVEHVSKLIINYFNGKKA
jgi:dTDP-4-amino-4,6-dideoxygalactose transaminase